MQSRSARRSGSSPRRPTDFRAEPLEGRRLLTAISVLSNMPSAQITGPSNLVEDKSDNLFFLATNGSSSQDAGVYELPSGASSPTLLVSFPNQSNNIGSLAFDVEGDLVGIANTGGANNDGFVWELKTGASSINTLASFDHTNTGSAPQLGANLVTDAGGDLFGTTQIGGADNGGTVWELAKGSTAITPLASFQQSVSNQAVNGLTIDSNGNLFGTIGRDISVSGAHGSVWELPKGASSITVLAAFNGTNGDSPSSPLSVDASGNVFGVANGGGSSINATNTVGDGVVFEIAAGSNSITDLASFTGTNGSGPQRGLIADATGNLFGTTHSGGSGQGVVFELPKGSTAITALGTFDFTSTGTGPNSLLINPSGLLVGTTALGGSGGGGTVFQINPGSGSGGGGGGGGSSALTGTLTGKFPSSVVAGQRINFNPLLTLTNPGSSAVSGPVTVKLFLSTGTTVDTNSVFLTLIKQNLDFKPHGNHKNPFKVKFFPASTPNNTYHPVAEVTDPSGITFDVSSPSTIQVAAPHIDLSGRFSRTPVPGKGGKTRFGFTVSNNGNTPAAGNLGYRVLVSPDGQFADATAVADLSAKINVKNGKSQNLTGIATLPAGSNYVFIQLDTSNAFNDVDTTNNTFATPTPVTVK